MITCSVENCEITTIVAKGLCMMHYKRKQRTGTTDDKILVNKGKKCKADGCHKDARIQGYCGQHSSKIKRYDNPHAGTVYSSNKNTTCLIFNCYNPSLTLHLCSKHYFNFQYYKRKSIYTTVDEYINFRNEAENNG